jgi:hypothetical protein
VPPPGPGFAAAWPGEKAWNANAFIAWIKAGGRLAAICRTWMGRPLSDFPGSPEGIPFTAG